MKNTKSGSRVYISPDFMLRNSDRNNRHEISFMEGIGKLYNRHAPRLSEAEIKDIRSRIKAELFDVLTERERLNFDRDKVLERINKAIEKVKQ